MAVIETMLVSVLHVVEQQLHRRQDSLSTVTSENPSSTVSGSSSLTSSSASPTTTGGGDKKGSPTNSPLLFFVALGFGVVFTNLWIIVGVKYCFRYNARTRAARLAAENGDAPAELVEVRPRRRREKKLMSMEEVNNRFPLIKYKSWVASRAAEGLPTAGGVTVPQSRPASRSEESTPWESTSVGQAHSNSESPTDIGITVIDDVCDVNVVAEKKKDRDGPSGVTVTEKDTMLSPTSPSPTVNLTDDDKLQHIQTTNSDSEKTRAAANTEDEDEDADAHIHTAAPPEMLSVPGDMCAICIDSLEEDDDVRGLTCGHAFHASCLDPWLTCRRACCPLCKADYYTPKRRPEGEQDLGAVEAELARRNAARASIAQPSSAHLISRNIRSVFSTFPGRSAGNRQPSSINNSTHRQSGTRPSPSLHRTLDSIWPSRQPRRPRSTNHASVAPEPTPSSLEAGTAR